MTRAGLNDVSHFPHQNTLVVTSYTAKEKSQQIHNSYRRNLPLSQVLISHLKRETVRRDWTAQ